MTASMLIFAFLAAASDMFTIHAEVADSITLNAQCVRVRSYLNDPNVFRRHFPGILNIRQINATQSEWTYELKPPLSSARRTAYIVTEREADINTVIFETDAGTNDYMYCRAQILPACDTTTRLTLELRLQSSREHGSAFHFLAPVLGQNFISARMRDQLKSDITVFFKRINDELESFSASSHRP
jgi:carbon monoxide dehydrogenase subunit G